MNEKGALFDTHVHLDNKKFGNDLENIILQAREAGVEKMISVGSTLSSSENAVRIASNHEGIYASVFLELAGSMP